MNEKNDITLDQVIEQSFDFSGLSEGEKNNLIGETSGMIMETALLRALNESGEEVQKKFNDFLESEPNEEEMAQFINEHFPNFGEKVLEEVKLFQEGNLEETSEATE